MPIAGPRKLLPRRWEKARESNGIAGIPVYKKKRKIPDAASRALKGRQSPPIMNLARSSQHRFYLGEIGRIVVAVKLNLFEVI